ncbi:dioxygenase [Actinoplanes sp. NPDC026623]|uniref:dioxygenase family protein n=1 Tax=Actinoplanes sp. NPDC026623 TaxID=3155610 RepID=UPI0033E870BB
MKAQRRGITEQAVASFAGTLDPRLRELLTGLTGGLHQIVRQLRPTLAEWEALVAFLTEVGQRSDDKRQEFILLSDVLGISSLVEEVNGHAGGTPGTVLGPFHVRASPPRALGDSIDETGRADLAEVRGRVSSVDGTPLANAVVDVWQSDDNGYYDVQQPGRQPEGNGRGLFRTDEDGSFWFRTVVPSEYPVPTDGPVGRLLAASRRHAYRPAHIHVICRAPGHEALTTHLFVAGSPYLDSDAVFAVNEDLIVEFTEATPDAPRRAAVDLVLVPDATGGDS